MKLEDMEKDMKELADGERFEDAGHVVRIAVVETSITKLLRDDVIKVVSRLPKDVVKLLKDNKGLILGGGFIRDIIANERAKDIDLFVPEKDMAVELAGELAKKWGGRKYKTGNAITILAAGRSPVQIIKRWLYPTMTDVILSFDYSIAQATLQWCQGDEETEGHWHSACSSRFYADLASKRLTYLFPSREEDAGGSLLRAAKFLRNGYSISPEMLASVISRTIMGVGRDKMHMAMGDGETAVAAAIAAKLREVDPLFLKDQVECEEIEDAESAE